MSRFAPLDGTAPLVSDVKGSFEVSALSHSREDMLFSPVFGTGCHASHFIGVLPPSGTRFRFAPRPPPPAPYPRGFLGMPLARTALASLSTFVGRVECFCCWFFLGVTFQRQKLVFIFLGNMFRVFSCKIGGTPLDLFFVLALSAHGHGCFLSGELTPVSCCDKGMAVPCFWNKPEGASLTGSHQLDYLKGSFPHSLQVVDSWLSSGPVCPQSRGSLPTPASPAPQTGHHPPTACLPDSQTAGRDEHGNWQGVALQD